VHLPKQPIPSHPLAVIHPHVDTPNDRRTMSTLSPLHKDIRICIPIHPLSWLCSSMRLRQPFRTTGSTKTNISNTSKMVRGGGSKSCVFGVQLGEAKLNSTLCNAKISHYNMTCAHPDKPIAANSTIYIC